MRTLLELACESISTRRTRLPLRARPAESEIVVDVLPVPPFWLAIEITICVNLHKSPNGVFQQVTEYYLLIRIVIFYIKIKYGKGLINSISVMIQYRYGN